MADQRMSFGGSIPENYDRHLGRLFFDSYAADLAARIPLDARQLLEVACGTGRLTSHAAARLKSATIVATDVSEPMLAYARSQHGTLANVDWRAADGMALPFPDASFDAVVCQFGLMFFPDKPAGLREAFRVLKPGGRFIFSVWDSVVNNPLVAVVGATVGEAVHPDAAGFLDVPHGFADSAMWLGMLREAGFVDESAARVELAVTPIPAIDVASGFMYGTPMFNVVAAHDPEAIEPVRQRLGRAFALAFGDPVRARMAAFVLAAAKPGA